MSIEKRKMGRLLNCGIRNAECGMRNAESEIIEEVTRRWGDKSKEKLSDETLE
jgi:hypothetical protein